MVLGPSRHGLVYLYKGNSERPTDKVFNEGRMRRDFTYVDDIVEGVIRVTDRVPVINPACGTGRAGPGTSKAPTGFTISATTIRSSCFTRSRSLRTALVGRQTSSSCRCNRHVPATFADVSDLTRSPASSHPHPLRMAFAGLLIGHLSYHSTQRGRGMRKKTLIKGLPPSDP